MTGVNVRTAHLANAAPVADRMQIGSRTGKSVTGARLAEARWVSSCDTLMTELW
jgi:hypothetical protein